LMDNMRRRCTNKWFNGSNCGCAAHAPIGVELFVYAEMILRRVQSHSAKVLIMLVVSCCSRLAHKHTQRGPDRAAGLARLQRGHARDRVAEDGCDVVGRVLRAEPGARGPRPQRHARPAVQPLAVQQREAAWRVQLQVPA